MAMRPIAGPTDGARATASRRIHCVFLVQLPQLWPSWNTLWRAMMSDPQFRVTVVALPFVSRDHADSKLPQFLLGHGVPYVPESAFDLVSSSADVVFVQSPYDETRPPQYSAEAILRAAPRLAYVPYALDIGGGKDNFRLQFDLPVQQKAWRVFVRSQRYKSMFGRYCSAGSDHVVVTGHPRSDMVLGLGSEKFDDGAFAKLGERPAVLWNPHFSFDAGARYSTFMQWKDCLARLIAERSDVAFIVRPHPFLRGSLVRSGTMTESEVDQYFRKLAELPNAVVDESEEYLPAFKRSDAMISDVSSFLLEYFLTGKPILYLRSSDSSGLNDDGDIVERIAVADDSAQIDAFVEEAALRMDPLRQSRIAALGEYFYRPDGQAGWRIKEYVLRTIRRERAESGTAVHP
jgi:hypothetical protein